MPNYQNSKIYKLVCGDLTYIGSTTQKLSLRKASHKADFKRWKDEKSKVYVSSFELYLLDCDNVDIVLIEKYPCEDKIELHKRERWHIENTDCVNKHIPTRSKKEYRENNKELIKEYNKEYKKEYYEKNKEKILEKMKEYYENNKEKVICECGAVVRKCGILQHKKTLKHQEYENSI